MTPYYQDDTVTLHHGDCLDVLATLPDASVDAVVTDPPYGLANTDPAHVAETITRWVNGERDYLPGGSGFMGKAWDAFVPPVAVWDECLRVLKPGGHVLTFAGSRTVDLMTLGLRLAGFDIRDSIAWLYGCHDDQTEVLTRRGWVNGLDLAADDDVAQWSIDGTVELVRPTARQRYDYDGDLIAFRNADVDQLVTPNHRVYRQVSKRRQIAGKRAAAWSDWQVDQAADINRWQPMRLPAAGIHDGPGVGGTDYAALLGWVWAEGGFDPSGTGVRAYQSSTNAPLVDEIAALFDRLGAHKRYDYVREWKGRPYTATTWFITGDLARRVRADLPGKSPTYELLWRMTSDEKRALWDAAMKGDGSKAQRAFWQKSRDDLEWAQALLASIGCRGKIADDPRGVIHWTDRPTVELQARHLAAADPVPYLGEVWCVTVPSGAFIVRRNGRVSVSGNSGFPKSLDVSKAIDKMDATHERRARALRFTAWMRSTGITSRQIDEATGTNMGGHYLTAESQPAVATMAHLDTLRPLLPTVPEWVEEMARQRTVESQAFASRDVVGAGVSGKTYGMGGLRGVETSTGAFDITAPATPDAERWQGWGTALKPAFEPVVVARKPLTGTVAANVLEHGTGALNIDGCRVAHGADVDLSKEQRQQSDTAGFGSSGMRAGHVQPLYSPSGRWPTNVVLDDTQAAALDEQSGESTSTQRTGKRTGKRTGTYGEFTGQDDVEMGHNDSGGASRFFPTFRYEAKAPASERPKVNGVAHPTVKPLDLLRWMVRLVTPPGGTVLEPFAGSGTTVEACVVEGFKCIAIEKTDEYLPLTVARIHRRRDPVAAIKLAGDDLGLFDLGEDTP